LVKVSDFQSLSETAYLATLYEDPIDPVLEGEERPSPNLSTGRISLRSINVVNNHIASLETARLVVTSKMEALVLSGLETLVSVLRDGWDPIIDLAPKGPLRPRLVTADSA
jgi:hypothetical protein